MTHYLVDTNHLSPLVTQHHPLRQTVLAKIDAGHQFSIVLPALHEFLYGIKLTPRAEQNLRTWSEMQHLFQYYQLDLIDIEQSADLRVFLRRQGWQLQTIDSFIAVIALRYDLTVLTTDKDFRAVPNLRYENWR